VLNCPGGEEGGKEGRGESRVFFKIWKTCSAILVREQTAGETCKLVIGQFSHVRERRALIG